MRRRAGPTATNGASDVANSGRFDSTNDIVEAIDEDAWQRIDYADDGEAQSPRPSTATAR